MELSLVKLPDQTFKAAYDSDYEKVMKVKVGEIYKCQITKPRNYEFHKKYFALINMVYENQELFDNIEDLRSELTIKAGFFSIYHGLDGNIKKKANSISFSEMDGFQFQELYERTKDVICIHFRFTKESIEQNIHQYY
jgi:hypothetical protein